MTLYERTPDRLRVGWPAFLGYARVGPVSILNLLGLKFRRVGPVSAISIG
jgi:hypothetical protein